MAAENIPVRDRWNWLGAVALLCASWVGIAAMSLQARADADVVAVAYPLWWSTRDAILAAAASDALIVRGTALAAMIVVRPARSDGVARLRHNGAWLVMDPKAIAACL